MDIGSKLEALASSGASCAVGNNVWMVGIIWGSRQLLVTMEKGI